MEGIEMETSSKNDMESYIEVKSFGNIFPRTGTNIRIPYEHQKKAMEALDKINREVSYSTLVVLPTGGRQNIHCFYVVIEECY